MTKLVINRLFWRLCKTTNCTNNKKQLGTAHFCNKKRKVKYVKNMYKIILTFNYF